MNTLSELWVNLKLTHSLTARVFHGDEQIAYCDSFFPDNDMLQMLIGNGPDDSMFFPLSNTITFIDNGGVTLTDADDGEYKVWFYTATRIDTRKLFNKPDAMPLPENRIVCRNTTIDPSTK